MIQQAPNSIEAEQALLGSMLLYPDTARITYETDLQPGDFFIDANRKIYQVMSTLFNEKKPVDPTTVITRLSDTGLINSVGGADYIATLTDVAISSANVEHYIDSIKEKALLRKLIEAAEGIKEKGYQQQYDAYQVLNDAEEIISKLSRSRKTTEFKTSKDTFDQVFKNLVELTKNHEMTGVPSGFKFIDDITNGFQKGDLVIIAARPSVGKTAFALNLASNAALKANKTVAVFSLEMPATQLASRMLSATSRVDSKKIRKGEGLTNDDWGKIDAAIRQLGAAKVFYDDSSTIKVNDIFAKCRKLQDEQGLDMVIIDYLQLIAGSSSGGNTSREQEVSGISRGLKQMARELDVPVIALAQLSRTVEKNDREPILSDLRESGAIEQDADIVMFIHREKKKKNENEENEQQENEVTNDNIKIIIAKHRNGSIGAVPLAFEKTINRFETIDLTKFNQED